jgi:hypothetical protein
MQEHVKCSTPKDVGGDYLDSRVKNKPVLMLECHVVGVGGGEDGGCALSANKMKI